MRAARRQLSDAKVGPDGTLAHSPGRVVVVVVSPGDVVLVVLVVLVDVVPGDPARTSPEKKTTSAPIRKTRTAGITCA
jgi:hypothetical protein